MVLQVHDELLFEVDMAAIEQLCGIIYSEMEGAVELKVPLRVDLKSGPNWAELHPVARPH